MVSLLAKKNCSSDINRQKKPNVSKDKLSKQVAGKISNFILTFSQILRKQAAEIALNPVQTATVAANYCSECHKRERKKYRQSIEFHNLFNFQHCSDEPKDDNSRHFIQTICPSLAYDRE